MIKIATSTFLLLSRIMLKEETVNGEKHDVALISVSETWQGIQDSQIKVYTDWSSCQFEFEEGKEYLLYTFGHDGKFRVMNCGNSVQVIETGMYVL